MPEEKIDICGEGVAIFAQKYGLDRHVSQKHGEIEKCDQCEYKAHSGTTMSDHKMKYSLSCILVSFSFSWLY